MSTEIYGTEATSIDLIAMRNWHFMCSIDKNRSPYMRRWHRGQVRVINARIPRSGPGSLNLVKVAVIELLAGKARKQLHQTLATSRPFDWRQLCGEAIMELEMEIALRKNAEAEKCRPESDPA